MSDELEWPEGWRWYRNPTSHGGEPYLAHPHDCELTLNHIRRLVAFHGLALVPAADVPTPEERAVLEAARLVAGSHDNGECRPALNDELAFRLDVLDGDEDALAELARRAAKEAKGG